MNEKEAQIEKLQAEIFRLMRDKERIELAARQQMEPTERALENLRQQVRSKVKELEALEAPEPAA